MVIKKRYIWAAIAMIALTLFFLSISVAPDKSKFNIDSQMPRIGQKLWTYNMNKHEWRKHSDNDEDTSKEEIILQMQFPEGNGGYTSYYLLTGNGQVPKEDVWIGEGSQEFLIGKKLYSYFPKTFEFYEIIFNGVKFIPRKLSLDEISEIFKGYRIIKVSELHKGTLKLKASGKNNKFIIINDDNIDFYKYYVVPNDSKKMQIEDFSNQFKVTDEVEIKIQRLEGCSKNYPCYEIKIDW